MKALATLIRLHRQRLDEARTRLASLERERDTLTDYAAALAEEIAAEAAIAAGSLETLGVYAAYRARAAAAEAHLGEEIAAVEAAIVDAHAGVAEAFRRLKTYEITAERRREAARRAEAAATQRTLDEVGRAIHRKATR